MKYDFSSILDRKGKDAIPMWEAGRNVPVQPAIHQAMAPRQTEASCCVFETPIGRVRVTADGRAVTGLGLTEEALLPSEEGTLPAEARRQLLEYFEGTRRTFDLPLAPEGTPFQQAVWRELRAIPYGQTASYGDIAARLGRPKAARAVGMANHRNPILILIPCHRVVGKNGSLTGFACGLERKEYLLSLESRTGENG